ncbi:DUF2283 domain-containing protein [Nonomuraea sp. NPDC047897]|jgi:uncharacterized protein YuzE|uniref:DUF2283 domain-containing protein n=1 Tax=Nonomuraea sp. NPDC047897 TaxID=3364346 RepID=UPI003719FC0D
MRLSYDLDADALYIYISDAPVTKTVEIDDETMVDLDSNGELVGIEVITIDRIWPLDEVLRRFRVSEEDVRQLRALFPVGEGVRREVPVMTARTPEPVCSVA